MRRAAACALIMFAAGCSSTSTAHPATTTTSVAVSAEVQPSDSTPLATSSSAGSAASTAVAAGNPVIGTDLCALLQKHLGEITSTGSPAKSLGLLVGVVGELVRAHPSEHPRTNADLDAAATATCPAARSAALKAIGADSIRAAFGG
ncbi:MAG: hypothetical protein QOI42_2053 [Frankiaceae bacterium]|nr:hypothetical protein [Frankiaceae bacterium]